MKRTIYGRAIITETKEDTGYRVEYRRKGVQHKYEYTENIATSKDAFEVVLGYMRQEYEVSNE